MLQRSYFSVLFSLAVAVLCQAWPAPTALVLPAYSQEAASVGAISQAISKTVRSEAVRAFVSCHFRAAVWGGYDAQVQVGARATSDSGPRTYRITKGRFYEEIDPQGISGMAEKMRQGIVSISTPEAAFAKGVPVYISDVVLVTPESLRFTVTFNPAFQTSKQIFPRVEEVSTHTELFLSELKPSAQPQQITSKLPITVSDTSDYNFGVLINNNVGNTPVLCVSSNEIKLQTLLRPGIDKK